MLMSLLVLALLLLLLCSLLALAARCAGLLRRIEVRQAALEADVERVRLQERELLLAEERQRLMREIHDSIGAGLAGSLATIEGGDAIDSAPGEALRRAIADLQLTVDSLESVSGDLPSLLGNLRYRLMPQLDRAGIQMQWQVQPLPPLAGLDAAHALHVLRIGQEAFSNILQHAAARQVRVTTQVDGEGQGVWVEIADDGRGYDPAVIKGGRGLGNMAWRAAALGGRLDMTTHPLGGTVVRLWLPLQVLTPSP